MVHKKGLFSILFILFILFWALYFGGKRKRELSTNGKTTKAVILRKFRVGDKRLVEYSFFVDGIIYNSKGTYYGSGGVGDSIEIIYSPKKPKLNKIKK